MRCQQCGAIEGSVKYGTKTDVHLGAAWHGMMFCDLTCLNKWVDTNPCPCCGGRSMRPDMSLFEYSHLPPDLAKMSERFADLAEYLNGRFDKKDVEASVALRKLLEAKDAAVRAQLMSRKTT